MATSSGRPKPGRHRAPRPSAVWLVMIALASAAAGWAGGLITSGQPPAAVVGPPPSSSSVPASTPRPTPPRASPPRVSTVSFGQPARSSEGLDVLVPPPEKVPGGVLLTIVVTNRTSDPITLDTTAFGPHGATFNRTPVPADVTPDSKRLVPGEGFSYQARLSLPTMNVGQLQFRLDELTVAGRAAGD